ncbi:hypothetical protein LIG30_1187 [Burkholderia sp. lig30]|nr:hypothetical protein LIG30_1187 [Burkholderia sp. lig30]
MKDSRALSFYVEDVLLLALACALAARDATQPWPAFGGIALPPPGAASLWLLTLLACAYLTRPGAFGRARACRPRRARSALLGWLRAAWDAVRGVLASFAMHASRPRIFTAAHDPSPGGRPVPACRMSAGRASACDPPGPHRRVGRSPVNASARSAVPRGGTHASRLPYGGRCVALHAATDRIHAGRARRTQGQRTSCHHRLTREMGAIADHDASTAGCGGLFPRLYPPAVPSCRARARRLRDGRGRHAASARPRARHLAFHWEVTRHVWHRRRGRATEHCSDSD